MTTAAIYARVSTAEQAERGYSLDGQIAACREFAAAAGAIHVTEFVDDGYSGEFLDRPGIEQLRAGLRSKSFDIVICYDPDRLARKLAHQLILTDEIEKSGAKLQFVNVTFEQSPEGKLFYSIRGAVAEFEKEKIRERTTGGKKRKALGGKLTFMDKPYGYTPDREKCNYSIVESEAEVVRQIYKLLIDNQYGVRSLAFDLQDRGIVTRQKKPFSSSTLYKMIVNPMYAGTKMAFRKQYKTVGPRPSGKKAPQVKVVKRDKEEWVPVPVPAIVDQETWDKAQEVLGRNQRFSKRNTKTDYLLRNLIRCDSCGYTMTAIKKLSRGQYFYYYICPSK
jgi:site-specific DNA recombinase